jgi:hypothetical protein
LEGWWFEASLGKKLASLISTNKPRAIGRKEDQGQRLALGKNMRPYLKNI